MYIKVNFKTIDEALASNENYFTDEEINELSYETSLDDVMCLIDDIDMKFKKEDKKYIKEQILNIENKLNKLYNFINQNCIDEV